MARKEHPLEYVPFSPELVGQKPVGIVHRQEQRPALDGRVVREAGVKASEEERMAMLKQVKAKSFEKKDLLTADEFKADRGQGAEALTTDGPVGT